MHEALVTASLGLGLLLYALKRIWAYPLELQTYQAKRRAELLAAQHECERLATRPKVHVYAAGHTSNATPVDAPSRPANEEVPPSRNA